MPNGTLFATYVKCTQEEVANVPTMNDKGTKQEKSVSNKLMRKWDTSTKEQQKKLPRI